jgi:hypothetical protein
MANTLVPFGELSDLFFNHEHDTYSALFESENGHPLDKADVLIAITIDAASFVEKYPNVCDGTTAEDLADDFMSRL